MPSPRCKKSGGVWETSSLSPVILQATGGLVFRGFCLVRKWKTVLIDSTVSRSGIRKKLLSEIFLGWLQLENYCAYDC